LLLTTLSDPLRPPPTWPTSLLAFPAHPLAGELDLENIDQLIGVDFLLGFAARGKGAGQVRSQFLQNNESDR
jgi:hypothetical protein